MTDTERPLEHHSDTLAQAVQAEFKGRPTVVTAALKQFTRALNNRFPGQNIDVSSTTLHSPNWVQGSGPETGKIDGYTTTPLLEVMTHAITGRAQLLFSKEHYLTDGRDRRLALDMREVEDLLRRLPKVLVAAMQEALTDYWNEPALDGTQRWQWLSDVLRSAALVSMGPAGSAAFLDEAQADSVLQVLRCPVKEDRAHLFGADCTRVYLIDYRARVGTAESAHLAVDLLLVRRLAQRELVLSLNTAGNLESYDSLQAFADAEGDKWGRRRALDTLELQPYESIGDAFVTEAQALLNNQLEGLNFFGAVAGQDLSVLEDRLARLTDLAPHLLKNNPGAYEHILYQKVSNQLPDWLTQASPRQAQAYSRYLFRLGALQQATKGQAYNHDIPSAEQFARQALRSAMSGFGEVVDPDLIDITQYRNEDDLLVIVGPATGRFTSETLSLTRRALNNLAGIPFLASEFKCKDGSPAPAWMTLDRVRALITAADIGKAYPALVKRLLLDEPLERASRERLFSEQLRIQLPMLALENSIRGRSGCSEAGYRCLAAALQADPQARRVSGQVMVTRALAFKADVSNDSHSVSNMFIFGPEDAQAGPHILYRPLYPEALIEFASLDALLAEIVSDRPRPDNPQAPSLQKTVLAWMSPEAQRIYGNGGFLEPHPVGVLFGVDLLPSHPARLALSALEGDVLAQLYVANANVLAQLADEQTVSNAEQRWNTLQQLGEAVFNGLLNAVLPFLSGPAATVGWLLTMEISTLQALEPLTQGDTEPLKAFTFNLLINLAVSLLVHRLSSVLSAPVKPFDHHSTLPRRGAVQVSATLKQPIGPGVASAISDSVLDFSTPVSADSRQLLERYLNTAQAGRGAVIDTPAPPDVAVVSGRWYVQVPARLRGYGWANVEPAENGNLLVLDHLGRRIGGLELSRQGQGVWDIAPQMRVRGGGPGMSRYLSDVFADSALRARRAETALKVRKLKERIDELDTSIAQAEKIGQAARHNAQALADEISRIDEQIETASDDRQNRLKDERATLRKKLHGADIDYKKKARVFINGYLDRIKLGEEVAALLAKDPDYQREAIFANLLDLVACYGAVDENLIRVTAVWWELGLSVRSVFPLAFEQRTVQTDVPYSVLLETRKRVLNGFPERIRISTALEQSMTELEALDRSLRKGYLQRTGYLSPETQRLKALVDKREKNTDWLILHELMCLRGALAGDAALEPSLAELAGLEGLAKARLGAVTEGVLRVRATQGFEPRQRVEFLQEAISVYNDAQLLAGNLRKVGDRPSYVAQLFLEKFLEALARMRAIAEAELGESINEDVEQAPEQPEQEPAVTPALKKSRKRTRRPNERLIKTAEGFRVGDVRESSDSEPDETVVVHDQATEQQIIFYKDKEQDIYRQRPNAPVQPPLPVRPTQALKTLMDKGKAMLSGLSQLIANYRKDAFRYREPASLEDRFLSQTNTFSELATQLQQAMQDKKGEERASAVKVFQELKSAGEQLAKEGRRLRIELTKQLPPTAGSFEYLLREGEVRIENPSWINKSTPAQADFLLEYEIIDSSSRGRRQVLWYAHFHGSARSVQRLTEGHLKLARLRFVTVRDQVQHPELYADVVYPGGMRMAFAKQHFFDLLPPA